jgi:Zn-dependent protease/CBS domain-containing protein
MKWSWKLSRVAGIGIYVHWTFLLLVAWIVVVHLRIDAGERALRDRLVDAVEGVGFMFAVFACVVLHELGHALAARRYGVKTRDITLLPIGGLARLERIPEDPKQELVIAVAGPAVNVGLALLLGAAHVAIGEPFIETTGSMVEFPFLVRLTIVNVVLVAFNLLPAFPMDGGRVLRALLARTMDYARATQTAASIGQATAILFGIAGILFNPFLLFVALFVYLGAEAEAQAVQLRAIFKGFRVGDAMMIDFQTLAETDTLGAAADLLLAGTQHDFPVMADGRIIGVLTRRDLFRGLAELGRDALVGDIMHRDWAPLDASEPLEKAVAHMRQLDRKTLPVVRNRQLVGLITLENVGEWIMVQSALHHTTAEPASGILNDRS